MKRFALAVLLLAIACRNERPLPPVKAVDETTPQDGGTIIRRLPADPITLNPVLAASHWDRFVDTYLFTPLVNFDQNLEVSPGIAMKWDISSDGKVYTFHLNPAATFSDGSPVLASDVLFTLKKIADPQTEAVQIASGFEQVDLKGTHVIDDRTIAIAFKVAYSPQLTQFYNLMVIPEHVYAKGNFKTDYASKPVGAGPYRLVRRDPGKEIVLERRPDFWGDKPYLQTVIFKIIVDDTTAWNAMKRDDIDETQIPSDTWLMESKRPELLKTIDFRRFYTLQYNYVPWNNRDPLLSDKRVRRALSMCVDLQSIINNLYHGTARAMNGPFTPDQWAYNPDVPVVKYDPAGAQHILNSLGWLDTDGDGILDKDHKPFKLEMLITGGNSPSAPFAQLFQAELKKIGVQLELTTLDPSAFIQRILAGNYSCAYLSWDLDPDPDPFPLFHSSQMPPHGQNIVFYSNPQADALIEAGRREFKQSERVKIYRQFHALLADDQPYTWTIQVSSKWAVSKRLRNVNDSKGWGLFGWYPGELGWWVPKNQRRPEARR